MRVAAMAAVGGVGVQHPLLMGFGSSTFDSDLTRLALSLTNIKTLFNELAKKLTGIETIANPDEDKPARAEGFQLGGANDPSAGAAAEDGGNEKRKKGGCCGGGGKKKK